MSDNNVINIETWKKQNKQFDEYESLVEQLSRTIDYWRKKKYNGGLVAFVGIAFFADLIRQIAPDEEAANQLITDALKHPMFEDEENEMTEEVQKPKEKQRWWVPVKSEDKLSPMEIYEIEASTLEEAQELVLNGEGELVSDPEEDGGEPTSGYVNQDPDLL